MFSSGQDSLFQNQPYFESWCRHHGPFIDRRLSKLKVPYPPIVIRSSEKIPGAGQIATLRYCYRNLCFGTRVIVRPLHNLSIPGFG